MKALSVREPWASLIARGDKTVEVRSWPTKHRGDLVIVSSARVTSTERALCEAFDVEPVLGVTRAIVRVVDCVPFTRESVSKAWLDHVGDEAIETLCSAPSRGGAYAWILADANQKIPAIVTRGALNLYDVPDPRLRRGSIERADIDGSGDIPRLRNAFTVRR